MQMVKVKKIEIGAGMPKICAPIIGKGEEEILDAAARIRGGNVDLAEWRADWFSEVTDVESVLGVAEKLQKALGDLPLLFTFRTAREGGEREITPEDYTRLNVRLAKSGFVDLIDVELFSGEETVGDMVRAAHECGVKVIVSNHDFEKTPVKEEIVGRLRQMQSLGGDILKIAVMPKCKRDVLTLLSATEEMYTEYADRPLITMSMGKEGMLSRMCGEVFGSAVTFGAVGDVSAPGQIEAGKLRMMMEMLRGARLGE